MFEDTRNRLRSALAPLTRRRRLAEPALVDAMRDIRMALRAADVAPWLAEDFVRDVSARALAEDVLSSVRPGHLVVGIVRDTLINLLGPVDHTIRGSLDGPTVILMAGRRGSGLTTTCRKLARYLREQGRRPLLFAADAGRTGDPMFHHHSVEHADANGQDVVILESAARPAIEREMLDEVFFVCDATAGQAAVKAAQAFDAELPLTGVILTRLDGDTRGGAAMSVKAITGKPIRFVGVGARVEDFEEFHPDRMSSRILGMGDIVSLVEKAREERDLEEVQAQAEKIFTGTFTMNEFLGLFEQLTKMGPIGLIMEKMPGAAEMKQGMSPEDMEQQMARTKAMIRAMTPRERVDPETIEDSRRRRIAKGSGTTLEDVNGLLKEFKQSRKMFKEMGKGGGLMGGLARRGFRKKKQKQLKDIKATSDTLPFDLFSRLPDPNEGRITGSRRRLECGVCGAPCGLARSPSAVGEKRGRPVIEVRYRCGRRSCPAPEVVLHLPESRLSEEERKRWGRWR